MMMTAACRVTSRRRSPRHALAREHVAARDDGGPVDPFDRDARRRHRRLWDAATRDADPHESAAHRSTSVPRPRSLARLYASVAVARSSRAKPTDLKSVTWAGLVRPGRVPATSPASSATTCPRALAPHRARARRHARA